MSSSEIKNEIQKIIDNVPENALPDVLDYLKEIESHIAQQNVSEFLKDLHSKHSVLLSKLAQ